MAGIHPSRGLALVRVNSGTFGAMASTVVSNLNIVAADQLGPIKDRISPRLLRGNLRGEIEDVVVYVHSATYNGTAHPHMTIAFWGNDSFNVTAVNTIKLWGTEELSAGDFSRESGVATNLNWRGYVGGLHIPYGDLDNTGEFHVSIENGGTTAIAQGKLRFEFGFRPEFGG